jgi:hypothetical protein
MDTTGPPVCSLISPPSAGLAAQHGARTENDLSGYRVNQDLPPNREASSSVGGRDGKGSVMCLAGQSWKRVESATAQKSAAVQRSEILASESL